MIESGIDVTYPVFAAAYLAIGDARRGPTPDAGGEAVSVGSVAHQVVTAALAVGDYERAERLARVARQLLPDDTTAAADLARVVEAESRLRRRERCRSRSRATTG